MEMLNVAFEETLQQMYARMAEAGSCFFFFSPSLDHLVSSCITVIVNANAVLIYGWKLELKDGKADISDLVHSSSRSGEKMEDAVTCLAAHKHQKHLTIQI